AHALGERDVLGLVLAALLLGFGDRGIDDTLDLDVGRGGGALLLAEAEALRQLAEAVPDQHDVDLPQAAENAGGAEGRGHRQQRRKIAQYAAAITPSPSTVNNRPATSPRPPCSGGSGVSPAPAASAKVTFIFIALKNVASVCNSSW